MEKLNSVTGVLKLMAEERGLKQKVELWLLNDTVNRNNWKYINLEAHRALFAQTPILVAYVGNQIGDGHNFDKIRNSDGTITESFMSATAERIVGYFDSENDIRVEERDGKTWIVGTGFIWTWYARELVAKLRKQGLEGMAISIETLIEEYYKENDVEVFTKYQILGTTILGDDVAPAVADANIRVLSAIGVDEMRKMTLRVASAQQNPQNNSKGEQRMNIKDIEPKFSGYKVLALNGCNVAVMSEKGELFVNTVKDENGEIIIGDNVAPDSINIVSGETIVAVNMSEIIGDYETKIANLTASLDTANASLKTFQDADKKRKADKIREVVANRIASNRADFECDLADDICDDMLTDERVAELAELEDGIAAAERECDARCMAAMRTAKKTAKNTTHAWESGNDGDNGGQHDLVDDIIASVKK